MKYTMRFRVAHKGMFSRWWYLQAKLRDEHGICVAETALTGFMSYEQAQSVYNTRYGISSARVRAQTEFHSGDLWYGTRLP